MLGTKLGIPFIRSSIFSCISTEACFSFMVFSLHIWAVFLQAISQQVINQSIALILYILTSLLKWSSREHARCKMNMQDASKNKRVP